MFTQIAAIIGVILGVISLLLIVFGWGFWKRGVEDDIKQIKKDVSAIKEDLKGHKLAEFCMMTQTLWDLYVLDPLHKRSDIASYHSPLNLTEKGLNYIPDDIKAQLSKLEMTLKERADIPSGFLAVQTVGLDKVTKLAIENELSVQEMVAILSTYLSNRVG